MALTPADVHNVAFSRPRIGKRGYNEQEVDLFIDLVEQELTRHITEDSQLRKRNGALKQREVELAQREAKLGEREGVRRRQVRKHEGELRRQKAQLAEVESRLSHRPTPLPQQLAQLRFREAQ